MSLIQEIVDALAAGPLPVREIAKMVNRGSGPVSASLQVGARHGKVKRLSTGAGTGRHRYLWALAADPATAVPRPGIDVPVFFRGGMIDDVRKEAKRLDRSVSWLMQRAWKIARRSIQSIPSIDSPE